MALKLPGTNERARPYLTNAAIVERYMICEIGSDADHIAITNALSDFPLGVVEDKAAGADDLIIPGVDG